MNLQDNAYILGPINLSSFFWYFSLKKLKKTIEITERMQRPYLLCCWSLEPQKALFTKPM